MKIRKITSFFLTSALTLSLASAMPITLMAADGPVTINIPDDLAPIIMENKAQIETSLNANGISSATVSGYEDQIVKVYDEYKMQYPGMTSPFSDTVNNLNAFCDKLVDTIPNTQGFQNIYADAWIGKFIPNVHFGGGLNLGASSMDISPLKKTASALSIDVGNIPDKLAFPTATLDFRLGGIILPFDIGITAMKFDSTKLKAYEKKIDPVSFDYYAIGGDFRYAILKGGLLRPKVSLGAGYYFTKGSVGIKNEMASAGLDFKSSTILAEAQASIKILFITPFVGGKLLYSKSDVNWNVDANWSALIKSEASDFSNMVSYGILPSKFGGKASGTAVHPQVFGGVGLDLFILSATVCAGYDVKSKIISGAVSARIAW